LLLVTGCVEHVDGDPAWVTMTRSTDVSFPEAGPCRDRLPGHARGPRPDPMKTHSGMVSGNANQIRESRRGCARPAGCRGGGDLAARDHVVHTAAGAAKPRPRVDTDHCVAGERDGIEDRVTPVEPALY